jgi:adenylosuccinate synthase
MFAEKSDVVVRFQGGANAGHTIICDYGKFALHQLPSGVFYPHITNIIGNGVALNIPSLLSELETLRKGGVPAPKLIISERTQIMMPYHILLDTYEEERLAGKAFGSTKSGIAPFYSDKYAKYGFQVSELRDEKRLMERLKGVCEIKNVLFEHLYHKPPLEPEKLFAELRDTARRSPPMWETP